VPPFRRVESRQAGPSALAILVPPGSRTLVILRPRGLACDLLPARWDGNADSSPVFCAFGRDEAAGVARRVPQALAAAVEAGANPIFTAGDARGESYQVWLRAGEFVWVACHRAPGEAYRPVVLAQRDEAVRLAEALAAVCWPGSNAEQEYYFNTQHFA
jgi:hypothetical protein